MIVVLLTVPPGAPLRDPETGDIIGNSPFMDSLIFIITLIFLVGRHLLRLGRRDDQEQRRRDQRDHRRRSRRSAGLIFMLLLISQFIAYFNFTNMPTVIAVKMADLLERADIGADLAADPASSS